MWIIPYDNSSHKIISSPNFAKKKKNKQENTTKFVWEFVDKHAKSYGNYFNPFMPRVQ